MARSQVAVEDLERKLKNITAERDKLVEINRDLDDGLKSAKDKAKNKEQQFKDTDNMLKETTEKAKKDAAAADARIKKVEGDLAIERKKVQDLLPEVEKYKALKKDHAALDAAHKKLQMAHDALDVKLQQAEKDRIKAANDRAAAVKDKAETNAKLKIANSDIDRLTKAKKALEDRVDTLEKRLLTTEEKLADTEARLAVATAEVSRLEANLKQEEEDHAQTRTTLDDTEEQLLRVHVEERGADAARGESRGGARASHERWRRQGFDASKLYGGFQAREGRARRDEQDAEDAARESVVGD